MISAKVICDSTNWLNKRLTTFILEYPRYIHSELMTHRVFSKNSASSRAIPISKFIDMIQDNPVKPLWTADKKGMQGPVITNQEVVQQANNLWFEARDHAVISVKYLQQLKIHKQNLNRLLEPWMHIKIVLTGTEFENWFELRNHPQAHPEIQELARMMKFAMDDSTPSHLQPGQWHIPFGDNIDTSSIDRTTFSDWKLQKDMIELKVSVARCARVSYNNFLGNNDLESDLYLYNTLVGSTPLHASPAEHQARVPDKQDLIYLESKWSFSDIDFNKTKVEEIYKDPFHIVGKYVSNLNGWVQLRKLIENGEF